MNLIKYNFEGGIKKTEGQIKKHHTHFTQSEKIILSIAVDKLNRNDIHISKHSKNHISFLNMKVVNQVLDDYEIIEFNATEKFNTTDCRVLLRSKKVLSIINNGVIEKANICIVISIKTGHVITAYINCKNDKHNTINMKRYDETINILKYAK